MTRLPLQTTRLIVEAKRSYETICLHRCIDSATHSATYRDSATLYIDSAKIVRLCQLNEESLRKLEQESISAQKNSNNEN